MSAPAANIPSPRRLRFTFDVVTHLVGREFKVRYARAFIGWLWAIADPLARLFVLSFLFQRVIDLGIPNYPVYLFSGILAWSWFSSGISDATTSALDRRELLFRPNLPRAVVPVVSVLTDFLDLLAALPVLIVFLVFTTGIPWTVVLFPVVILVQFMIIIGIGFMLCTANVYVRDVRHIVATAMRLGFYVTPVFFQEENFPEQYRWVININPLSHVITAYRETLVYGTVPGEGFLYATASGIVLLAAGYWVYRKKSPTFVDEL
jgi:lipopolysaccharide transport system permease protein